MKITKVEVVNLLGWKTFTHEFTEPLTLILGANAVGKTSLARSLRLALTGRAGTDGVIADLVHRGATDGVVTVTIERGTGKPVALTRRVTPKGITTTVNGHATTKDASDFFLPPLTVNAADALAAGFSSFLDLAPGEQKSLLLGLIDTSIPPSVLEGLPVRRLGESVPTTLHDLGPAEKMAREQRVAAKRKLDTLVIPPAPGLQPFPNEAAVTARLTELRQDEMKLVELLGAAKGGRAALQRRRATMGEKLDKATVRLNEMAPEVDLRKAVDEALDAWTTGKEWEAKREAVLGHIREDEHALELVLRWRDSLAGVQGDCVIGGNVKCPLPPRTKQDYLEGFEVDIQRLRGQILGKREAIPDVVELGRYEKALKHTEAAVSQRTALEAEVAALQADLTALDADLATAADAPTGDAELATLRDRIAKGEGILATVRQSVEHVATRERALAEQAELKATWSECDALAKAFGPSGVVERLLGERIAQLQGQINDRLAAFHLAIEFTTPWSVVVNGVPVHLLAESERFRVNVAIAVTVANLTGVKFTLFDRFDLLDRENRGAMLRTLQAAVQHGLIDQGIVFATAQSPDQVPASSSGVAVITLTPEDKP